MIELLRTNDLVLLSLIEALLTGEGIGCFVADQHMSSLELGFPARRILVPDDQRDRAIRVLRESGLEDELKHGAPARPAP